MDEEQWQYAQDNFSKEEIKEAKGIIEAFKESKGGVTSYNGKMIDAPIVEVMKRKLSLIEE